MLYSWFPPADEVYKGAGQDVLFLGLAFGGEKSHGKPERITFIAIRRVAGHAP